MAQGAPIMYGRCDGGPWHMKDLAHHEPVYVVPIEAHSKKIVVAVRPGTPGYTFGQYDFSEGKWHWKPPVAASSPG
jgi:hypothetical protein